MHILEKAQPIPVNKIEQLQEFVEKLADKDVQSFGVCYVSRDGNLHAFHYEGDREYALPNAGEYLLARIKTGLHS